jgi:phospholipase/carboxylesterase
MSVDAYHYFHKPAAKGQPLLFLFHGTGGDENQFVRLGATLLPHAGLVSPRGDVSEFGAARFFRRTAEGVYDMQDLARATEKMAGFVQAHAVAAQPSAVFGLGYSNGANILASVIFSEPEMFDAAILMHPLIPFAPDIKGSLRARLLLTAGRQDPICPAPMTESLDAALKQAGADTEIVWHEGRHELHQTEIEAAARFLESCIATGQ